MFILAMLKGFFGSVFKVLFSDWRITLLAVVIAAAGIFAWKYNGVQKDLAKAQQTLKVEQENNQVLRNNLAIAAQVNKQNAELMKAQAADQEQTTKALSTLNNKLHARDKTVADLKARLAGIKEPPQALTPRISMAIDAMQKLRDEAAKEPK